MAMDPWIRINLALILIVALMQPGTAMARTAKIPEATVSLFAAPALSGGSGGPHASRQLTLGGGVMMDGALTPSLSLGLSIIYESRQLITSRPAFTTRKSIPSIFLIPVEGRFWVLRHVAVSVGPFVAFRIGRVRTETVTPRGTALSTEADHAKAELGMTAAILAPVPIGRDTALLLGARYLKGFSNGARNEAHEERIDEAQAIGGVLFMI